MIAVRICLALGVAFLALRFAALWGRFSFSASAKRLFHTSLFYAQPSNRKYFPLFQALLIFMIWLIWPVGHWGLLALPMSLLAFKEGSRNQMLWFFTGDLLFRLEQGQDYETAWAQAEAYYAQVIEMPHINVRTKYFNDPQRLIRYVCWSLRSESARDSLLDRWAAVRPRLYASPPSPACPGSHTGQS